MNEADATMWGQALARRYPYAAIKVLRFSGQAWAITFMPYHSTAAYVLHTERDVASWVA